MRVCVCVCALQGLCSRLQQPPQGFSVVVMSFSHPLHLIPQDQQPPQEVMTCLRALRFPRGENAQVVQNVLIDHANIERTVGRRPPAGGGFRPFVEPAH